MSYDSEVLADSPVVYLKLDDPTPGTAIVDSSGNGNDATIVNPDNATTSPGLVVASSAAVIAGQTSTNGYMFQVRPGPDLVAGPAVTIEGWVASTAAEDIAVKIADPFGGNQSRIDLYVFLGAITVEITDDTGALFDTFTAATDIPGGGPHHLVVRYDGALVECFLDAVSVGSVAFTGDVLGIAEFYAGTWSALTDVFDCFALYDAALSNARILAHYAAGNAPPEPPAPSPPRFAPRTLGCATGYQVIALEEIASLNVLTGASTYGRSLGPFEGFSSLSWDRRLDDTSEATITIPTNSDCCTSGFIGELHPWHHGIAIYRNGELVWDGPIVMIEVTRTEVVIVARDISALLSKRLLRRDLCFSSDPLVCTAGVGGVVYGPRSPLYVANVLINEALAVDGHGFMVTVEGTRPELYEGSYKRFGGPVFDLIGKLASEFINWTVLGRRIVLSHGGAADADSVVFGRTEMLVCQDFINDTFKVVEDGLAALTQDVQIADPIVVNTVEQLNIGVGQVFPLGTLADPYYGLLQGVQDANQALLTTAALTAAAINVVSAVYPPPLVMSADGLQLSPNAPVTMAELVPGTLVPIFADCVCKPVSQEFILSQLRVSYGADGEVVEPTFISKGSDNSGTEGDSL